MSNSTMVWLLPSDAVELIERHGRLPLPPYIERAAGAPDEAGVLASELCALTADRVRDIRDAAALSLASSPPHGRA